MRRTSRSALWLVLTAGVLLAGCSEKSSPTSPLTTPVTQEAADEIALQTTFALEAVGMDLEAVGGLILPASPGLAPATAARETSFAEGPLNVELRWELYDAQDQELADYGPTAVRLDWHSHLWGAHTTARDTATLQHYGDLVFTGIQPLSASATVNGTARDTLLNRFRSMDGSVTRYGSWRSVTTFDSVVVPRTPDAWPLSGTVTYVVRVDRLRSGSPADVEVSWSAVVVITFNGTSHPDVAVNGVYHYVWDMTSGAIARAA